MRRRYVLWCCAVALGAAACIVDEDDDCGEHQHRISENYIKGCVCDEGTVPDKDGVDCRRCGKHEVAKNGACACESGYARASAAEACVPEDELPKPDGGSEQPSTRGQDMPCESASDCAGTDATYCLVLMPPKRCLVQGCANGANRCASGRECCVITILPELEATGGLCVSEGTCVAPGMVVTP